MDDGRLLFLTIRDDPIQKVGNQTDVEVPAPCLWRGCCRLGLGTREPMDMHKPWRQGIHTGTPSFLSSFGAVGTPGRIGLGCSWDGPSHTILKATQNTFLCLQQGQHWPSWPKESPGLETKREKAAESVACDWLSPTTPTAPMGISQLQCCLYLLLYQEMLDGGRDSTGKKHESCSIKAKLFYS